MQIRDVMCRQCRSIYQVAISDSVKGDPGQFECKVCTEVIDRWTEPKLRVYRMIPPEGEGRLHISAMRPTIEAALARRADATPRCLTTDHPPSVSAMPISAPPTATIAKPAAQGRNPLRIPNT